MTYHKYSIMRVKLKLVACRWIDPHKPSNRSMSLPHLLDNLSGTSYPHYAYPSLWEACSFQTEPLGWILDDETMHKRLSTSWRKRLILPASRISKWIATTSASFVRLISEEFSATNRKMWSLSSYVWVVSLVLGDFDFALWKDSNAESICFWRTNYIFNIGRFGDLHTFNSTFSTWLMPSVKMVASRCMESDIFIDADATVWYRATASTVSIDHKYAQLSFSRKEVTM